MTTTQDHDLFGIILLVRKHIGVVIRMAILAIVLGGALYIVIPKKYEADTVFILKNPLYADRNNLYNNDTKFLDYAANDDDIDRLIAMASSDSLQNYVIRTMQLATVYDLDTTKPEQLVKLRKCFKSRLKIYRNEYRNVVLTYTDKDPARAAAIANLCENILEHSLREFYNGMRRNMFQSIENRIRQEDSAIAVLTDTLGTLREQYGIYDIISPARYNIMLSSMKDNGKPGYARGVELVQNIESIKDELVSDRAKHITLANQYATGTQINEMPLTQIIQSAKPPVKPRGLGLILTLIVSAALGVLFGIVYVLVANYFRTSSINSN